jgi:hypothetical protein
MTMRPSWVGLPAFMVTDSRSEARPELNERFGLLATVHRKTGLFIKHPYVSGKPGTSIDGSIDTLFELLELSVLL